MPRKRAFPREVVRIQFDARLPIVEIARALASEGIVLRQNPETTDVPTLDSLLLKGAVRYPTSAKLGENGNVVLFGHASYLPIVKNQNYRTFTDIQKLKKGDTIMITSSGTVYTYAVRTVVRQSAEDGVISLTADGRVLTLVTCDSFGQKSDRFVLTADLVESHPLGA